MALELKLNINKPKTSNFQIIVNDYTGIYSKSNPTGYGGENGNPASNILKYIFNIKNVNTGAVYTQIQSDDLTNTEEFNNPSIARIVNKDDVYLDSDNFELDKFNDSFYKIDMLVVYNQEYSGSGYSGQRTIVNVQGAKLLFDNYDSIIVGKDSYKIISMDNSTIILDRDILVSFESFMPSLSTSNQLILSDDLDGCLNKKIADMASDCSCDRTDLINLLSELQILIWGMNRSLENEDYLQAFEYFNLAKSFCLSCNCGC